MSQELFDQFGWRLTLEEAELPDGRKKKAVIAALRFLRESKKA